ncbi:MAG TPA: hypothetical protein VFZ00_01450 [Solirubrobacter sp.]|nr:hypothetical protein [Solirubrobacter sp.]
MLYTSTLALTGVEFVVDGEKIDPESLTFDEQADLRAIVRDLSGDPTTMPLEAEWLDFLPALATVARRRKVPDMKATMQLDLTTWDVVRRLVDEKAPDAVRVSINDADPVGLDDLTFTELRQVRDLARQSAGDPTVTVTRLLFSGPSAAPMDLIPALAFVAGRRTEPDIELAAVRRLTLTEVLHEPEPEADPQVPAPKRGAGKPAKATGKRSG